MAAKVTRKGGRNLLAKRTKKIPKDVCQRLQKEFKIALRGMNAKDVFRKFDKDRSGELSTQELIDLIRLKLRITPSALTDDEIGSIVAALDDDNTGNISIDELLEFVEQGAAAFNAEPTKVQSDQNTNARVSVRHVLREKPPDRYAWLQGEMLQGTDAMPVAHIEMASPDICNYVMAAMGYNPAAVYASLFGSPYSFYAENYAEIAQSAPASPGAAPVSHRGKRSPIKDDVAHRLQNQLKVATMHRSLEAILKKFDTDRNGVLNGEELRKLIRLELHLPDTVLSDKDINSLVAALDDDDSGTVSHSELIDFVEVGSATFFSDTHAAITASHQQTPASQLPRKSAAWPSGMALASPTRTSPASTGRSSSAGSTIRPRWRKKKKRTSDWDGAVVVFPVKDDIVVTTPDMKKKVVSEVQSYLRSEQFQGYALSHLGPFCKEVPSHVAYRPASAFDDFQGTRWTSPEEQRSQSAAARMQSSAWSTQSSMPARPHSVAGHQMGGGPPNSPFSPRQSQGVYNEMPARPHSVAGHYTQGRGSPTSPLSSRQSHGFHREMAAMAQGTDRPHSAAGHHWGGLQSPTSPLSSRPALNGRSSPLSSRTTRPESRELKRNEWVS